MVDRSQYNMVAGDDSYFDVLERLGVIGGGGRRNPSGVRGGDGGGKSIARANAALARVGRTYYKHQGAAIGAIEDALLGAGFEWDAGSESLFPLYNDAHGRGYAWNYPLLSLGDGIHWLSISMYRMPSGNYEVTAYVTKGRGRNPSTPSAADWSATRFVPTRLMPELVGLWHTAKTAVGYRNYDRMIWAVDQFHKLHPDVSSTAAYKDLDAWLADSRGGRWESNPEGDWQDLVARKIARRYVNEVVGRGEPDVIEQAADGTTVTAFQSGSRVGVLAEYYDYAGGHRGHKEIKTTVEGLHDAVHQLMHDLVKKTGGIGLSPERDLDYRAEENPSHRDGAHESGYRVAHNPMGGGGWWLFTASGIPYGKENTPENAKVAAQHIARSTGEFAVVTSGNDPKEKYKVHPDGRVVKMARTGSASNPSRRRRGPGRRNPEDTAAEMYETFHGRPSSQTLVVEEEVNYHENLASLGDMVEMKVATLTDKDVTLKFENCGVKLASNEHGTQLYLIGGDQSVDLAALGFKGDKADKESIVLGVLYELTYSTEKKFHKFQLTDYFHELGEETGFQPMLVYDVMNQQLNISGGEYKVKDVGIVN